jgi:thiamine-phosphate pyrophosphorylase
VPHASSPKPQAPRGVLPRLYPILDLDLVRARGLPPLDVLDAWLDAGVRLVQLRAKTGPAGRLLAVADAMVRRCRTAGARLIVNDRADVAAMAGAGGVHLGQEDLAPAAVRAFMDPAAWVGLSTHTDAQVDAGCREPVTYLAIGPVFSTATKDRPDPCVSLEGVERAAGLAHRAGLPIVAIGGITLATTPSVLRAGADAVAVIADLFTGDPADRAREYLQALA